MTKRERQILDWIIQDPMVTQETLAKPASPALPWRSTSRI